MSLKINRDSKLKTGIHITVIQLGLLVIPIVTIPYVVSRVGLEKFGLFVFIQSIMGLLAVIINYGFVQTGVVDIANAKSLRKLNFEYSNIFYSKTILLFFCMLVSAIMFFFIPKFNEESSLYTASLIILVFNCLDSSFVFQGIERMKDYMIFNFAGNFVVIILLFFFIRYQEDYIYLPLVFFGPRAAFAGAAMIYAALFFNIKPNLFFLKSVVKKLRKGFNFFATNIFSVLYTQTTSVILGFLGGNVSVGIYSLADKLCFAYTTIQGKIGVVYQPQVAQDFKLGLLQGTARAKENIFIMLLAAIPAFCFCQFFAEDILYLFFQNNGASSANILRLLSFNFLTIGISGILSVHILVAIGKADEMLKPSIWTALINLTAGSFLIYRYKHTGAAASLCLIEFGTMCYYYFRIKKFKIFVFSKSMRSILAVYGILTIILIILLKFFEKLIDINKFFETPVIILIYCIGVAGLLKFLNIIDMKKLKILVRL
ncbi:oligosaccharide flippase family protein [Candidatus Dependentiae bacterium]|nr:oligosaccharide flippase family protein [Candidatus Dependentiae bacterium]